MRLVEDQIYELNSYERFNLSSPKQISEALFGKNNDQQSTDREALLLLVQNEEKQQSATAMKDDVSQSSNRKKSEMAQLILEWRAIRSQIQRNRRHQVSNSKTETPMKLPTLPVMPIRKFTTDTTTQQLLSGKQEEQVETTAKSNAKKLETNAGKADNLLFKELQQGQRINISTRNNKVNENDDDPYVQFVLNLFQNPFNTMDGDYWKDILLNDITKPSARSLVSQLNTSDGCPMGYDPYATPGGAITSTGSVTSTLKNKTAGKKGTLLQYVRDEKLQHHPTSVVLTRVGEFYEAFGIDALLLVQYCGLNPMGKKLRAGMPYRNIQMALNDLIQMGFRVAVYEEIKSNGASGGSATGNKLKPRMLAQVVSTANPIYMYDLIMENYSNSHQVSESGESRNGGSSSIPQSRPYVGIIHRASGFVLVEISFEELSVRVSERLTPEAVECHLVCYPPSDPLFYVPAAAGSTSTAASPPIPSFLQRFVQSNDSGGGGGSNINSGRMSTFPRIKQLPPNLYLSENRPGLSDIDIAKSAIVNALLQTVGNHNYIIDLNNNDEHVSSSPITENDFILIHQDSSFHENNDDAAVQLNPLYVETATQLGLMTDRDPSIPPLIPHLLSPKSPLACRKFLRRWLLSPPPPNIAKDMSRLIRTLKDSSMIVLPPLHVHTSHGTILNLLRSRQASASLFREIDLMIGSAEDVLVIGEGRQQQKVDEQNEVKLHDTLIQPLMSIIGYESGMKSQSQSLLNRCEVVHEVISNVVVLNLDEDVKEAQPSTFPLLPAEVSGGVAYKDNLHLIITFDNNIIPQPFWERNEVGWRRRIYRHAALDAYENVERCTMELKRVIAEDFWGISSLTLDKNSKDENEILFQLLKNGNKLLMHDIINNLLALKELPSWISSTATLAANEEDVLISSKHKYYHPRDRNGKPLRNRYTTDRVERALSSYKQACEDASERVTYVLQNLSDSLSAGGHLPTIVQAYHLNLVLCTVVDHASRANSSGWGLARMLSSARSPPLLDGSNNTGDKEGNTSGSRFEGLWPYWMDQTEAVTNTFELDKLFLLTAPNMSGKSTLMRSTAAVALLSNVGLCSPISSSSSASPGIAGSTTQTYTQIPHYDTIFVRAASADIPSENKSAFGAEMTDIASLFRSCTKRSLVFVDELGRGTSPKQGTALASSIFEDMAKRGMKGMFATHLHGILGFKDHYFHEDAKANICTKRMGMMDVDVVEDNVVNHGNKSVDDCQDVDGARHSWEEIGKEQNKNTSLKYGWTYKLEDGVCTDSMALTTAKRYGLPSHLIDRAMSFAQLVSDVEVVLPSSSQYPDPSSSFDNNNAAARTRGNIDGFKTLDAAMTKIVKVGEGRQISFGTSENEHASTAKTMEDAVQETKNIIKTMEDAVQETKNIIAKIGKSGEKNFQMVRIPPRFTSPPSLEGHSCVYILEIGGEREERRERLNFSSDVAGNSIGNSKQYHPWFYVGETESLSQRLSQHRSKGSGKGGVDKGDWKHMNAVVFPITEGGKSMALTIETLLIRRLSKMGYPLISLTDGRHRRSPPT